MSNTITDFHLPRYEALPNVGLYLDQTVHYLNECLHPLHIEITASMVSNYVKKDYVMNPIRKLYYADHIAYLFFIILSKQALAMENIAALMQLQKQSYTLDVAYDYFCSEIEITLNHLIHNEDGIPKISPAAAYEKRTLHTVAAAVAYILFLNQYFFGNPEQ